MRRLTATALTATVALSLGSGAAVAASTASGHDSAAASAIRIRHVNRAGVKERSSRERRGRSFHDSQARELRDVASSAHDR